MVGSGMVRHPGVFAAFRAPDASVGVSARRSRLNDF